MADSVISALTAVTALTGTTELPTNQAGTNKKVTVTQLDSYISTPAAASTAAQTGFATDTYLTGSAVTVDPTRLGTNTFYRCVFQVVKTLAGTVAPIISIRMGTAASTADTAVTTLTFAAQTAVVDEGEFEIKVNFRAVGATAVVQAYGKLQHRLVTTGLNVTASNTFVINTSASFSSTAVTKIGLSVNAGTSAAWTTNLVQSDIPGLS